MPCLAGLLAARGSRPLQRVELPWTSCTARMQRKQLSSHRTLAEAIPAATNWSRMTCRGVGSEQTAAMTSYAQHGSNMLCSRPGHCLQSPQTAPPRGPGSAPGLPGCSHTCTSEAAQHHVGWCMQRRSAKELQAAAAHQGCACTACAAVTYAVHPAGCCLCWCNALTHKRRHSLKAQHSCLGEGAVPHLDALLPPRLHACQRVPPARGALHSGLQHGVERTDSGVSLAACRLCRAAGRAAHAGPSFGLLVVGSCSAPSARKASKDC